ncbi:hypothetical protein ACOSQ4_029022 [Xanthoceras sorbifolium]
MRKFASNSMSKLKPYIPNAKEALKKRREKTAASAQKRKQSTVPLMFGSLLAPTQQPSIASSPYSEMVAFRQAKKKQNVVNVDDSEPNISISFPTRTSTIKEYKP